MRAFNDPLAHSPQRILVVGVTGAGKTTLAARIGERLAIPHIEIDALFHGPEWTPRPEFLDDVRAFACTDRWVTEWQYLSQGTGDILPARADLLVWLDYPYRTVRSRLVLRTLKRRLFRTRLWNGNREPALWSAASREPVNDILRWQTSTLRKWDERLPAVITEHPHLIIVRLRTPREADRWVQSLDR